MIGCIGILVYGGSGLSVEGLDKAQVYNALLDPVVMTNKTIAVLDV